MRIGLGSGMVGHAPADQLAMLGHEVPIGARAPGIEAADAWAPRAGTNTTTGPRGSKTL